MPRRKDADSDLVVPSLGEPGGSVAEELDVRHEDEPSEGEERVEEQRDERQDFGHTPETAKEDLKDALDYGPEDEPSLQHRASAEPFAEQPAADTDDFGYEDGSIICSKNDDAIQFQVFRNRSKEEVRHASRGEGDDEVVVPPGFYLATRSSWGRNADPLHRGRPDRLPLDPVTAEEAYKPAMVPGRV